MNIPAVPRARPMAATESFEYLALVKCKVQLASELSSDPHSVLLELVSKGLVPESALNGSSLQLENDGRVVKAGEIVTHITDRVESHPESFKEFIDVLGQFRWLRDIKMMICERYDELRSSDDHDDDDEEESPSPSPPSSPTRGEEYFFKGRSPWCVGVGDPNE